MYAISFLRVINEQVLWINCCWQKVQVFTVRSLQGLRLSCRLPEVSACGRSQTVWECLFLSFLQGTSIYLARSLILPLDAEVSLRGVRSVSCRFTQQVRAPGFENSVHDLQSKCVCLRKCLSLTV